jgi:hypothetical protein
MEHKQVYQILLKHKITGYFRYADDILIVYNQEQTNIDKTIIELNKQNNNIEFKVEKQHHNSINFLDLTQYTEETSSAYRPNSALSFATSAKSFT